MKEEIEWRSLSSLGFSKYYASNTGLIMNIETKYTTPGSMSKRGYWSINIYDDNKKSKVLDTHRLIAFAFHGSPPTNKHTVDHIDRIRSNNNASNLRWATKSEQNKNQNRLEFQFKRRGKAVTQMTLDDVEIMTWFLMSDAERHLNTTHISRACKEGNPVAGYKWKYAREDIPGELWKELLCEEFKVRVWVSTKGRIATSDGFLTFGTLENNGYKGISIPCKNKKWRISVHRLVMYAYHGYDERDVNHKDGNKRNNKLENLEYMTRSENVKHAYNTGLHDVTGRKNGQRAKRLMQIDISGNIIACFPSSKKAAEDTGFCVSTINKACREKTKYKGFLWVRY